MSTASRIAEELDRVRLGRLHDPTLLLIAAERLRLLESALKQYDSGDCQLLAYGQCSTVSCLKRGGWEKGKVDPDVAIKTLPTCPAYVTRMALTGSLRV